MKLKKLVLSGLATTAAFGVFAGQVHADEVDGNNVDPKEVLGSTEENKDLANEIDKGGSKIEDLLKSPEDANKLIDAKAEAKKEFAGNEEAIKQIEAAPTLYDLLEVVLPSLRNPENNETGFSTKEAAEKAAKEALKDDKVNNDFEIVQGGEFGKEKFFYKLIFVKKEVNKDDLKAAVAKAEKMDRVTIDLYNAIQAAKAVVENEEATQADVDAALKTLNEQVKVAEDLQKTEAEKLATMKAELKKLVEKADGFKTVTIDLYNANKEAKALLEKEDATLAELKAAFTKLEKEISIKEDLDKKENGKEETEKPQTAAEKEVAELKKWVKYADSLKKMTIDVHNALDEAKALLKKENISYDEAHKALEKLFFALEDGKLLPKKEEETEKPNKPGKDWTDLIDWDKLKELIAKKDDKKPGKKEEVKTGKKEEAKKEAKKLPQTGAVASVAPAALGLALAAVGAGFAFRKQD